MKRFDMFLKRTANRQRWLSIAHDRFAELASVEDGAAIARMLDEHLDAAGLLECARISGEEPRRAVELLHSVWKLGHVDRDKAEQLLSAILAKWGVAPEGAFGNGKPPLAAFH